MFITFFIYLLIPFCTGSATSSGESAFPTREVGTVIPKVLQAILVDRYGEMHGYNIAKHQLALDLKLPLRDMRLIDPSFPGQTQAAFAARPNALLFTFENIKVIVQKDHALVFGTTQADVVEFVPALQAQLRAVCSTDSRMRFEHTVIETALNVVCTKLLNNVRALSPGINTALQELQAQSKGLDVIQTQVDGLLPLKNQLDGLRKRIKEVERAIKDVLDNDADMAMMHLGSANSMHAMEDHTDTMSESTAHTADAAVAERGAQSGTESGEALSVQLERTPAETVLHTEGLDSDSSHTPSSSNNEAPEIDSEGQPSVHRFRRQRSWYKPSSYLEPPPAGALASHLQAHHLQQHQQHREKQHKHPDSGGSSVSFNSRSQSSDGKTAGAGARAAAEVVEDATMSLEILLENYLNEVGWVGSEIDEHLDKIINTEENAALQIDLLRNRILRFELALSMSSFVVSCAALVTGLFGMNLLSHVELHPLLFWSVAAALLVGMTGSWFQLRRYGKRERLF